MEKMQGYMRRTGDRGKAAEVVFEPTDLIIFNEIQKYSPPEFVWNFSPAKCLEISQFR